MNLDSIPRKVMVMIVCLGTTPAVQRVMLFQQIELGMPNRATREAYCASGKSINAAKVLHALGAEVLAITVAGGATGKFFQRELQRLDVAHDLVETSGPTRICTTAISEGPVNEFVEEAGPVSSAELNSLWKRLCVSMEKARILLLSGSLAPGVPDDFYAQCLKRANQLGVQTIIDARGAPLQLALPHKPFVVKPNRAELAATIGMKIESEDSLRQAIQKLIAAGPSWAIVSSGSEGVIVSDGDQFFKIHPPKVPVISPIGSGDAFAAGLAAAFDRGQQLPEAARLAVACGASNAANLLPGQITIEDIDRYQREITVEKM